MKILNLTQHQATPEQVLAGVVEPINKKEVQELLTFTSIPTLDEMADRAIMLAEIVTKNNCFVAMIGGAPFFMSILEFGLQQDDIGFLYSFSERVSVEVTDEDGNVIKTNVFKHTGWVK
jgi:hypothetical protein